MPKALRLAVVLALAATTLYAVRRPPINMNDLPYCFDLPGCNFPDPHYDDPYLAYHYSHQCAQGPYVRYVYINAAGDWCLYGPVLP